MTKQHPITPPPEMVRQWSIKAEEEHQPTVAYSMVSLLAAKAAQWGADQELEACCEWTAIVGGADALRAARRPKPPSLKEQALQLLETYNTSGVMLTADQADTIRRALEALPND